MHEGSAVNNASELLAVVIRVFLLEMLHEVIAIEFPTFRASVGRLRLLSTGSITIVVVGELGGLSLCHLE